MSGMDLLVSVANVMKTFSALILFMIWPAVTEVGITLLRLYRMILGVVYYFVEIYRQWYPKELYNKVRRSYIWFPETLEKIPVEIPEEEWESVSLATLYRLGKETAVAHGRKEWASGTLVVEADLKWSIRCLPDSLGYYLRFNTPYMQSVPIRPEARAAIEKLGIAVDVTDYLGHNLHWNIYSGGLYAGWRSIPDLCQAIREKDPDFRDRVIVELDNFDYESDPETLEIPY
jgi:hypothetical protein